MKAGSLSQPPLFLNASVLIFSGTQVVLFALFPFLAQTLSLPMSEIILCFSLGSFLFLFGSPYWSSKSDVIGRKPILQIGLAGLGISFGLIILLIQFHETFNRLQLLLILTISRIIYGLMASSIVQVAQLARKDLVQEGGMFSSLLSHSLSLSVGRIAGPVLLLVFHSNLNHLLYALTLIPFLILILGQMSNLAKITHHTEQVKNNWKDSFLSIKLPLLVTVLFTMYLGVLYSSLGHTIETLFSFDGNEASLLMAKLLIAGSVAMAVCQVLAKFILKKDYKLSLYLGLALLALGAITLAFMGDTYQLWLGIILVTSGISLIQPGHLALVHEMFPQNEMGKKIGLLSVGNTIGHSLGGPFAAIFLSHNVNKSSLAIIVVLIVAALTNASKVKTC